MHVHVQFLKSSLYKNDLLSAASAAWRIVLIRRTCSSLENRKRYFAQIFYMYEQFCGECFRQVCKGACAFDQCFRQVCKCFRSNCVRVSVEKVNRG